MVHGFSEDLQPTGSVLIGYSGFEELKRNVGIHIRPGGLSKRRGIEV
jgi:hypothetical protein